MLFDDAGATLEQYADNYVVFGKALTPKEYSELVSEASLKKYNEVYRALTANKVVHFFGKISDGTKKKLRAFLNG